MEPEDQGNEPNTEMAGEPVIGHPVQGVAIGQPVAGPMRVPRVESENGTTLAFPPTIVVHASAFLWPQNSLTARLLKGLIVFSILSFVAVFFVGSWIALSGTVLGLTGCSLWVCRCCGETRNVAKGVGFLLLAATAVMAGIVIWLVFALLDLNKGDYEPPESDSVMRFSRSELNALLGFFLGWWLLYGIMLGLGAWRVLVASIFGRREGETPASGTSGRYDITDPSSSMAPAGPAEAAPAAPGAGVPVSSHTSPAPGSIRATPTIAPRATAVPGRAPGGSVRVSRNRGALDGNSRATAAVAAQHGLPTVTALT